MFGDINRFEVVREVERSIEWSMIMRRKRIISESVHKQDENIQ